MSGARKGAPSTLFEAGLAALIVLALFRVCWFYLADGYLPPPFFDQPDDTFMDWYNTAYWAHRRGAFSQWLTVYPPVSFVLLKLLSLPDCYLSSGDAGRQCDPVGAYVVTGLLGLNLVLCYLAFRQIDSRTAAPRAVAVALGMPMLFAWERGNLILPCFTAFVLGHSRILRSARLKWACVALTANFKPYLALPLFGWALRRRWRWVEGVAVAGVLIYAASFTFYGDGSPMQLQSDIRAFVLNKNIVSLSNIEYATSYAPLVKLLKTNLPIMRFTGSRPIEVVETVAPMLMRLGAAGVLACLLGAWWRPAALSITRVSALTLTLLMTLSDPGGYAIVFVVFLLFLEPWRGPATGLAIVSAYLLCLPLDLPVATIAHVSGPAWLSGQSVTHDLAVTAGMLVRPLLLLLLEYGLVAASLSQLLRHLLWSDDSGPRAGRSSSP